MPKTAPKTSGRPLILDPLFRSVRSLKGIGPKQAPLFENLVGTKIKDLLFHLPSGFLSRTFYPSIDKAENGKISTLIVEVVNHIPSFRRGMPYKVRCKDAQGDLIDLIFFHAKKPYLVKLLPLDEKKLISGRVDFFHGIAQMVHPDFVADEKDKDSLIGHETIYPLTTGLTSKPVWNAVHQALKELPQLDEWLDTPLLQREGWKSFGVSLNAIHTPKDPEVLQPNSVERQRLAYDEILSTQLALALVRHHQRSKTGNSIPLSKRLKTELLKILPFELTGAQAKAIAEIESDIESPTQMLRLLQGDVGSGKTIVALISALHFIEQGKQAAIMAPTEILARQHFEGTKEFCKKIGIQSTLLTSNEKGRQRKEIYEAIEQGTVSLVFGTHALFQDAVTFHNLGFVTIDEQHRFGVHQRLKLTDKGNRPDVLVMTATPIPRTLTLTAYGDMDVSRLNEKPKGRKPIETKAISLERLPLVIDALKEKISQNEKVYWVCPLVEESEKLDLAAAEERYKTLVEILGKEKVGLVHGRLKANEKEAMMQEFKHGSIDVLVSTTVIEVGVDVHDATVMIIEHAERFGLSQLHQLRGRVGRGKKQSTCILLYSKNIGNIAKERLQVMRDTNDGFIIAEKDLELRGSGEILGTRQSGLPEYRLANLFEHGDLIAMAFDDAKLIINKDPFLTSERGKNLKTLLYIFERDQAISYLRSG